MSAKAGVLERVIDLVVDETGARRGKIREDSQLGEDLGIDGDDADDLMDRFFREFSVDRSGYNFLDHFGMEGFRLKDLISPPRTIPVRISDLVRSVEAGRWIRPGGDDPEPK